MLILRCRIEKCGIGEGNIYQSSTKTENVVCVIKEQAQGLSLSDRDTQSMIINFLCILSHAFFYFWHSKAINGVRMSESLQIVFIIWPRNLEMVVD